MWTKAEMDKLTVEQQEVVARFELSLARQREQLLKQVRGDNYRRNVLEGICFAVSGGGSYVLLFHAIQTGEIVWYACSGLVFVNAWICIHTALAHRRLDALLKLLDFDHKIRDHSNNSKTEKAG